LDQLHGIVARALGEYSQAHSFLKRSLDVGLNMQSPHSMATPLVSFAELFMEQGQTRQAAEWLSLALHDPGTEMHSRREAKRLLEVLASQLSAKELKAAIERGKTLDLTEVVQGILATL
jgi:ATP/maltotriose-dependent transcriptional regulator MalT